MMRSASDSEQGRSWTKQSLFLGVIVCAVILVAILSRRVNAEPSAGSVEGRQFQLSDALVLGVVEGVTEYLPVSSTGHLLLSQHILGLSATEREKEAADAYAVIIQIGAILAVLSLYRRRVEQMARGCLGRDPIGLRLGVMLLIAFLPAAFVGLAFEKTIKHYLFGLWPIVIAWLVGGLVILIMPKRLGSEGTTNLHSVESVDWRRALLIGVFQVLAMWPGVSRSLATIVGGLVAGLGLAAAVEFSFLLGLITLGAATTYEFLKDGPQVITAYGIALPIVGVLSSFVAAWVSVKWLVGYLQQHGLAIFGYYRVALALVTAWLLFKGIL
ncbi:MAG: undecaprenyl-diphosphate phosphatase [Pirellulaceae bacterium]